MKLGTRISRYGNDTGTAAGASWSGRGLLGATDPDLRPRFFLPLELPPVTPLPEPETTAWSVTVKVGGEQVFRLDADGQLSFRDDALLFDEARERLRRALEVLSEYAACVGEPETDAVS